MRMRMGEESEMSDNRVEVLLPGMIRRDGPMVLEARSTATLVSRGDMHIIVDTSGPENRQLLIDALGRRGMTPGDIGTVVLTHSHGDHLGNLELFKGARVLAHRSEGGDLTMDRELELMPGVRLLHTPGHTPGSISLLVEAEQIYVIAGDAIPTVDNVRKWVPPGHHYDRAKAMESMTAIVEAADVIVPGHGPQFAAAEFKGKGR